MVEALGLTSLGCRQFRRLMPTKRLAHMSGMRAVEKKT
jgi:hypothetical protein